MNDAVSTKQSITVDNRGFSLVELIICVAILAIATIPLYQSMTLSARTNAKAQSIQNATSLGESVMEEIKASSIYDLQLKYNGTITNESTSEVEPKITLLSGKDSDFFGTTEPTTDAEKITLYTSQITAAKNAAAAELNISGKTGAELLTGKVDTSDDPKKPYYVLFKKDAVSTQGEKFSLIATLRTSSYMKDKNNTASDANSIKLPKIEEIDTLSQAVITTKEFTKYDAVARDYFKQNGDHYDDSKDIKYKEIIIDKTDNWPDPPVNPEDPMPPDPSFYYINVKCRVVYMDYDPTVVGSTGATYSRDLFVGTFSQPDAWDSSTPVASNIYLFYKKGVTAEEKITITDKTKKASHKVYLIMQDSSVIDDDTVVVMNNSAGGVFTVDQNSDLDTDGNKISGDYELITNMTKSGTKGHLYKEESNIRIYDVAVHLFKQNADGSIGDYVTSVESTKESNDAIK